jgi:hypothetical protein
MQKKRKKNIAAAAGDLENIKKMFFLFAAY